ncbi:MAG: type VI secretion system lipoprotein TssJ [Desulfovibrio sp.]|nr:type VI secretion system lipoprotein TssJ [Desulfovibrio sp.]
MRIVYANCSYLSIADGLLKIFLLLALFVFYGQLAACGGSAKAPKPTPESEDPDNVLWGFGDKAIHVNLSADRDLNAFDGRPHSLQLCVYQLAERDAFDRLAGDADGAQTLLQCASFDNSVKSATRIFIQPGENAVHSLNRAEGALLVGVACGFFESTPEQSVKLWQIPLKKKEEGYLLWKSILYSAGGLDLDLHLSAHAMAENDDPAQGKNRDKKPARGKQQ